MNKTMAVEIDENVEHRFKHCASFRNRERALRENLGEVFFSMLHHDVETIPVTEAATADVEDAEQVGMCELHDAEPERELEIGNGPGGNEFDSGLLRLSISELREENGGVVCASKVMP